MPIHDWSRIPSGIFHDFHQTWCIHIKAALNSGLLPKGLSALVEQRAGPYEGDVLAVESPRRSRKSSPADGGGLLTLDAPATSIVRKTAKDPRRDSAPVVNRHRAPPFKIIAPGSADSPGGFPPFPVEGAPADSGSPGTHHPGFHPGLPDGSSSGLGIAIAVEPRRGDPSCSPG